jgi:hypothetical protein
MSPEEFFNESFDSENYDQCECCGSLAVVSEFAGEMKQTAMLAFNEKTTIESCMVCGDTKLTNRFNKKDQKILSQVFQINMQPYLKREAEVDETVHPEDVEDWKYYLGDVEIGSNRWHALLYNRRDGIASAVVN